MSAGLRYRTYVQDPEWAASYPPRKSARCSLGGEVWASGEVIACAPLLREFYEPVADLSPGVTAFELRESLFAHLRNKKTATKRYLGRRFPAI